MYSPPDPSKMQRPSGGCEACGGPVHTYKQGIGLVLLEVRAPRAAHHRPLRLVAGGAQPCAPGKPGGS